MFRANRLFGWLVLAGGQAPAFRLPQTLQAKLTLGIDALSYRGNIVRQARLEAALLRDSALTADERRLRAGLLSRQVTLR